MDLFRFLLVVSLAAALLGEVLFYTVGLPDVGVAATTHRASDTLVGWCLYGTTHALSYVRAPLSIAPYISKVGLALLSPDGSRNLTKGNSWLVIERVRDVLNLLLSIYLARRFAGPPAAVGWGSIIYVVVLAEVIRLVCEFGQIAFSGTWQCIPHRSLAAALYPYKSRYRCVERYCAYYGLDDDDRLDLLFVWLQRRAQEDRDLSEKLSYLTAFRVVPNESRLLAGVVRDVARGHVWIKARWTNDPWLVIGLGIRRSPWVYDPRYNCRPFYYRTTSSRQVTKVLFTHYRYCGPFLLYQVGQEIRSGRYLLFFKAMRWVGLDLEEPVRSDGSYRFDPLLSWIFEKVGRKPLTPYLPALASDDEVLGAVIDRIRVGETPSPLEIAEEYCYPLKYVEEVLVGVISRAASSEATE